jgi:hypothetical protein
MEGVSYQIIAAEKVNYEKTAESLKTHGGGYCARGGLEICKFEILSSNTEYAGPEVDLFPFSTNRITILGVEGVVRKLEPACKAFGNEYFVVVLVPSHKFPRICQCLSLSPMT